MRTYVKLILAAATATVVLGAAVSSAAARRIETSEQRFHQVWSALHFKAGIANIACATTLEGSFHSRTISKVAGQLIGYISRAITGSCSGGSGRALTETLPWHITYESFGGILPRITEIHFLLIGAAFRVESLGVGCLAKTSTTEPAEGWIFLEPTTGQVRELEPNPNKRISLPGCSIASFGTFEGLSEVFARGIESGNTTRITVRLVQ